MRREGRGSEQMAGVPPWANGACPGAHWDALDHLVRESMKQHPLSGFPIEATWKRGGRLTRSDATNILSHQLRVVSHITHRRADLISACAGMNEAQTGLDVKTEYVSPRPAPQLLNMPSFTFTYGTDACKIPSISCLSLHVSTTWNI